MSSPPPAPPPGHWHQYGHGGYDHAYGYGPPGVPKGPSPQITSEDTTWGLMAYLGTLLVGFIAPLIVYFARKNRSLFVRFHAAQALNYQLTALIQVFTPLLVAIVLALATDHPIWFVLVIPTAVFHALAQWVLLIMGTIKASQGEYWRFPVWLCFPMIR